MNPLLLGGLFDLAGKVFDKLFPNPAQAAEAKLKLFEMQQRGELAQLEADTQLALGQMEINKIEAGSDSFFKSGWRPSVGWICTFGLAYQIVFRPLFTWVGTNVAQWTAPPPLELDTLMTLLFGMLGLGAYRTYEKVTKK
jgi:hypothetical protein